MKTLLIFFVLLGISSPAFSQAQLKPTDDPLLLHNAAMENIQKQAEIWEKIAIKERDKDKKALYHRFSESFLRSKEIREEQFLRESAGESFHYETRMRHNYLHKLLTAEVIEAYGKDAPRLPPEVRPSAKPTPSPEPTPELPAVYKTESGFEVKLKLEE